MCVLVDARNAFQSHAGSIEARNTETRSLEHGSFQSHAGSIEARVIMTSSRSILYGFNPTLVRLRRKVLRTLASRYDGFNPTLVRLRRCYLSTIDNKRFLFQSHAGSIEAKASRMWGATRFIVSIPRWFD